LYNNGLLIFMWCSHSQKPLTRANKSGKTDEAQSPGPPSAA
jgi:hypothetical protein